MASGSVIRGLAKLPGLMRGLVPALMVAAVAGMAPLSPAAAEGLQAGLWQVTTRTIIPGAPPSEGRNNRCLTPEAVADLDRTFSPVATTVNANCDRTEHDFTPARLKWRLVCKGNLDMDVSGEFRFETPQRYTATLTTLATIQGRVAQQSRAEIEAVRTGDCP